MSLDDVFYAQTLTVVNLIVVNFFGLGVITRTPVWTEIGHMKATSLPDLPKPKRVKKKQQENQNLRPKSSTKNQ